MYTVHIYYIIYGCKTFALYLLHITSLLLDTPKFRILVIPSMNLSLYRNKPLITSWLFLSSRWMEGGRKSAGKPLRFYNSFSNHFPTIPKRPTQTPRGPGAQPRFDTHSPSALRGGKRSRERHQTYNVRKPLLNPITHRKREHRPGTAYVEVDGGVGERYWAAFTEPLKIGGLFYFSLHSDLNQRGHGRTDARSALVVLVSELGHEEQHKLF